MNDEYNECMLRMKLGRQNKTTTKKSDNVKMSSLYMSMNEVGLGRQEVFMLDVIFQDVSGAQ